MFGQVTDPGFLVAELPGLVRHYGLAARPAGTAIAWLAGPGWTRLTPSLR